MKAVVCKLRSIAVLFFDCSVFFFQILYYYVSVPFRTLATELLAGHAGDDLQHFANRTVLITGSARGLGACMARTMAHHGALLVMWDIDGEQLKRTCDELTAAGLKTPYYFVLDLSQEKQVADTAQLVRETLRQAGHEPRIHCLINNAASMPVLKRLHELDGDELRQDFSVDVMSHFWIARHFLPDMLRSGQGHIVTISSVLVNYGLPLMSCYIACKAANDLAHRSLRLELKHFERTSGWDLPRHTVKTTIVYPYQLTTRLFNGIESRVHFLFPAIHEQEAADAVVTGIIRQQEEVFIPWYFRFLRLANVMLPSELFDLMILKILGAGDAAVRASHSRP